MARRSGTKADMIEYSSLSDTELGNEQGKGTRQWKRRGASERKEGCMTDDTIDTMKIGNYGLRGSVRKHRNPDNKQSDRCKSDERLFTQYKVTEEKGPDVQQNEQAKALQISGSVPSSPISPDEIKRLKEGPLVVGECEHPMIVPILKVRDLSPGSQAKIREYVEREEGARKKRENKASFSGFNERSRRKARDSAQKQDNISGSVLVPTIEDSEEVIINSRKVSEWRKYGIQISFDEFEFESISGGIWIDDVLWLLVEFSPMLVRSSDVLLDVQLPQYLPLIIADPNKLQRSDILPCSITILYHCPYCPLENIASFDAASDLRNHIRYYHSSIILKDEESTLLSSPPSVSSSSSSMSSVWKLKKNIKQTEHGKKPLVVENICVDTSRPAIIRQCERKHSNEFEKTTQFSKKGQSLKRTTASGASGMAGTSGDKCTMTSCRKPLLTSRQLKTLPSEEREKVIGSMFDSTQESISPTDDDTIREHGPTPLMDTAFIAQNLSDILNLNEDTSMAAPTSTVTTRAACRLLKKTKDETTTTTHATPKPQPQPRKKK